MADFSDLDDIELDDDEAQPVADDEVDDWDADDDEPVKANDAKNDFDDVDDDWETAPDFEEIERQKKEAEEKKKREAEEAKLAEKKRIEERKAEAARRKELKKKIFDDEWDDGDDFMDGTVEAIARENAERLAFEAAKDAFGDLVDMGATQDGEIDIGRFIPETIADFNNLRDKIVEKINTFKCDRVVLIKEIINGLVDDYASIQMKQLSADISQIRNNILAVQRKKDHKHAKKQDGKTFMNASNKQVDDDDDFM